MKSWLLSLWLIVDVLVALSALSLWIVAPSYTTLNISLTVFALSLALILLILKKNAVLSFVKTSYFKKALTHTVTVFLVISITALVNFMGSKKYREWDFSQTKMNTLTDQSLKVLSLINAPLEMKIFAKREEWKAIIDVLKLYQAKNDHLKIEAFDIDTRPDLVKANEVTSNRTVILKYKGKNSRFLISDELSITNGLLKIAKDEKHVIYFSEGHNELTCHDETEQGISLLCNQLRNSNYEVKTINLSQTTKLPSDATGLVIIGPQIEFLESEINQIRKFLENGGSLMMALSPAFQTKEFKNLKDLLPAFGLSLGHDLVVDRLSTVQGAEATIPVITKYSQHVITRGFATRTLFPLSSSVKKLEGNDTSEILAETSSFPGSWAETNLAGTLKGKADFNQGEDIKGPIGLMGIGEIVEGKGVGARLVLLGSSAFFMNGYQSQSGNLNLALNALSWFVNDEGIIALNRPGIENHPVLLSEQHLQMIFFIAIILIPVIFMGAAIFVYRKRRLQ